jgi:hypothetical protein
LGVNTVGGVVEFDGPATFRLARERDGSVRLLTDTGARLDGGWVGADPWQLAVRSLDGNWVTVDAQCTGGVPADRVREWQARNERTMIEFRMTR